MNEKSKNFGTLWLSDTGIFPETDSSMKLAVNSRKAKDIKELVERWKSNNFRMRAVVNNTDVENLARLLGFTIGSEGVVSLTQGCVILVRKADNFLIKEDSSLDELLSHFRFSVVVGA